MAQDIRGACLDDTCVGDPRNLSLEFVQGRDSLFFPLHVESYDVWTGGKVKGGDSCFRLLSLPVAHGNEQFGLECEVLLLSLPSAVSGSRTFLYLQFNVYAEGSDHTGRCI